MRYVPGAGKRASIRSNDLEGLTIWKFSMAQASRQVSQPEQYSLKA
jgi:hypothetical protein